MNGEKPVAFVARYDGCKKVVSHGGYVFPLDVTFDDVEDAVRICGGMARPDVPMYLAVTRITDEAVLGNTMGRRQAG